jgi:hypothetical protein
MNFMGGATVLAFGAVVIHRPAQLVPSTDSFVGAVEKRVKSADFVLMLEGQSKNRLSLLKLQEGYNYSRYIRSTAPGGCECALLEQQGFSSSWLLSARPSVAKRKK